MESRTDTRALRLELLGGFAAHVAGAGPRDVAARKARALLAHLALPPGRAHSREKLTALLWGDTPDALARQAFRQTLSRLRRGLGEGAAAAFVDGPDTVALDATQVWVDAVEFEATASGEQPTALERAAELYRGDFLDGLDVSEPPFEEWRTVQRERLRELALEALAKLLRHHMRADALDAAVQTALRILALDPLQEAVHRALMRLYVKQGRRGAALRQYQECLQSLQRELGAEPDEPTRALYRDILRSAGDSAAASARSGATPVVAFRTPAGVTRGALVGRAVALAALERSLEHALDRGGRVAVVSGEAGIGKTRLLEELSDTAIARGARVVLARCYETEQPLPFRPWVDALRGDRLALDPARVAVLSPRARAQLARLFPELPAPPADAGILADDHGALFEAVRELVAELAAQAPMVVVLEDIHWADPMSVRLLSFLGRRVGALPALFVASARPEDTVDAPVVERALAELRDAGMLDQVPLGPLSPEETQTLARVLHRGGDPKVIERAAEALWTLSEGNPFVIVEAVRTLRDARAEAATLAALPPSVREAVARRLARLSEAARTAAVLGAVIGRGITFALLRAASGLSEPDTAAAVEELVRRRVLEASGEALEFCHDRIRRVVYDSILPHRRAMLHEAVAVALESATGSDGEEVVDEIGGHFLRAGRGDRAYPYLVRFASLAQARYDIDAAGAVLRRAATAVDQLPTAHRQRARLELGLREAELLAITGGQKRCLDLLVRLEPLREGVGDSTLSAQYYFGLAIAHFFLGRYTDAHQAAGMGLAESERTGHGERIAAALFTLGLASIGLGDFRSAVRHAARAVALFDRLPSRRWQAQAYWLLAQSQVMRGEFADAMVNAQHSAGLAEAAGDTPFRSITTSVVAWVHAARGDSREAVESAGQAVALSRVPVSMGIAMRMLGYAHVEAGDAPAAIAVLEGLLKLSPARHPYVHALACLAEAHRMVGDPDRAAATAREAIEIAHAAGNLFNLGLAERALARVTADAKEARAGLDRAFVAFTASEAAFEVALTRVDLARSSAAGGDSAAAAAHLTAAIRTFHAAGAPVRAARARELARSLNIELDASPAPITS